MNVSNTDYISSHKFLELVDCVDQELANDWAYLIPYAFDVTQIRPDGTYYADVHGTLLRDYKDVSIYYLPVYIEGETLQEVLVTRFEKSVEIIEQLPNISKAFVIFVGPNSPVPRHVDDHPATLYNMLLGVRVPGSSADEVGIQIDSTVCRPARGEALIFSPTIPHHAWNKTDQWWVSIVLMADVNTLKLKEQE